MKDAHKESLEDAKNILRLEIINSGANATGRLLESVTSRLFSKEGGQDFVGQVYFKKPGSAYAYFADQGRRPGKMPPLYAKSNKAGIRSSRAEGIFRWFVAKGIPKEQWFIIRRAIGRNGTKGKNFMAPAREKIMENTKAILREKINKFKESLK